MAGEILKQRREELGRDIREIADLLKIKADYLVAIENDSFEKLPAPVYTMGYIRCYAAYLDINANDIVEFYTDHLTQPEATTIIPISYSQKKTPRFLFFIAALVVIGVAAFYIIPAIKRAPAPKETAIKPPSVPRESKAVPQVPQSVPHAPTSIPQKLPRELASPPVAAPAQTAGRHRLTVSGVAKAWILVRFSDGKTEEMLLKPNEVKSWDFSDQLVMKVGNAGGIRLDLDGRDLGLPGNAGEVKTITLPPQ